MGLSSLPLFASRAGDGASNHHAERLSPEGHMLLFATLFAAVAILGAFVGLGVVGEPIGGHALNHYGWGLAVNGFAIAAFLVFVWADPVRHSEDDP
jgi:hypothetical protein